MDSPSLEVSKREVDVALGGLLCGGLDSDGLMGGLNGLKSLFQPKQIYDSS